MIFVLGYANPDPALRGNARDIALPYLIAVYGLPDMHLGYSIKIGKLPVYANLSCFNFMNSERIIRGDDGATHEPDTFRGILTPGCTLNGW